VLWSGLVAAAGGMLAVILIALDVRRHSPSHISASVAIGGRGLFFSRTADGWWLRLRLRRCGRRCEDRSDWGEPPAGEGVREPRRPRGPGPAGAARARTPPA